MSTKVLICHSAADIYYCLALYELFYRNSKIVILVVNNSKNYSFLSSLNLDSCELVYIPYPRRGFFYPISLIFSRLYNAYIFSSKLKKIRGQEFYFFSTIFDYVAFYYMSRLATYNRGYLVDHYRAVKEVERDVTFKQTLNRLIFSFLAGKKLVYEFYNGKPILAYGDGAKDFKNYQIDNLKADLSRYKLKINKSAQKAILLFESNDIETHFSAESVSYQKVIEEVINLAFEKGYLVYLKPHPRLGFSSFLSSSRIQFLADYIPGEFISYEDFDLILGGSSKVIANISTELPDQVFSLIDILPFDTQDSREYYRSYLLGSSDGKLRFLRNIDELILLLK